jgi:serine/threonine protein kinase
MHKEQGNEPLSSGKTEIISMSYPDIPELDISQILGKGGSGTVYKGRQPFLKRDVAIKVLNVTNGVINEDFVDRFHREAQILAGLIHPHIVSCFQAGMTNASEAYPISPYLAMEFIDGPSLEQWIDKEGIVGQVVALDVIEKIAGALDYAHNKSIIHRDIKAENILLKPKDNSLTQSSIDTKTEFDYIPMLADLGIARSTNLDRSDTLTMVGTMIGTPSSMAPEQFNEPDHVDFKADIYGLGCVLFHMVTGKKPYAGNNLTEMVISKNSADVLDPNKINSGLNKKIVKLIYSMMAVQKSERPDSYADLIQQCQFIASELGKKNKQKTKKKSSLLKGKWIYIMSTIGISVSVIIYFLLPMFSVSEIFPGKKNHLAFESMIPIVSLPEQKSLDRTRGISIIVKNFLKIQYADKNDEFLAPGESFNVVIETQQNAHIYCYFENQQGEISRFFPNRFNSESYVLRSKPLVLPGDYPFKLFASEDGISERVACFSSAEDVLDNLPAKVIGVDFETLPVQSLEQVKDIYLRYSDSEITDTVFDIRVY